MDNKCYSGPIDSTNDTGQHVITYDDDEVETLSLADKDWRYTPSGTLQSWTGNIMTTLQSNKQNVLGEMLTVFGNRLFQPHHTQAFDQTPLIKAYEAEEKMFPMNFKCIPRSKVLKRPILFAVIHFTY